jgi:hypothetical protein
VAQQNQANQIRLAIQRKRKKKVMSRQIEKATKLGCKEAKPRFALMLDQRIKSQSDHSVTENERQAVELHLSNCSRCAQEYRLFSLARTTLDLAASPEAIEPDKDFFVALRARIARGPESVAVPRNNADESWSAALWLTARQMMPALAMLLLVIIGATLLWNQSASNDASIGEQYTVRGLTTGDMLDRIIAEERVVAEENVNDR